MADYIAEIELGIKNDEGFKMLAQQKLELLKLIDGGQASEQMSGLINFLDHIQDQCVDVCGIPSSVVFPSLDEDNV